MDHLIFFTATDLAKALANTAGVEHVYVVVTEVGDGESPDFHIVCYGLLPQQTLDRLDALDGLEVGSIAGKLHPATRILMILGCVKLHIFAADKLESPPNGLRHLLSDFPGPIRVWEYKPKTHSVCEVWRYDV